MLTLHNDGPIEIWKMMIEAPNTPVFGLVDKLLLKILELISKRNGVSVPKCRLNSEQEICSFYSNVTLILNSNGRMWWH